MTGLSIALRVEVVSRGHVYLHYDYYQDLILFLPCQQMFSFQNKGEAPAETLTQLQADRFTATVLYTIPLPYADAKLKPNVRIISR